MSNPNNDDERRPLTPMEKVAVVGVAAPLVQQAADALNSILGSGGKSGPSETRER